MNRRLEFERKSLKKNSTLRIEGNIQKCLGTACVRAKPLGSQGSGREESPTDHTSSTYGDQMSSTGLG